MCEIIGTDIRPYLVGVSLIHSAKVIRCESNGNLCVELVYFGRFHQRNQQLPFRIEIGATEYDIRVEDWEDSWEVEFDDDNPRQINQRGSAWLNLVPVSRNVGWVEPSRTPGSQD